MTDVVTVERTGRSRGWALEPIYVRGRFRMAGRGSLAALVPHVEAGPIRDAAVAVRPDGIVFCQGGPIAEPEDAHDALDHAGGMAGYFGRSTMERLPTEVAITGNMKRFERITRAVVAG